MFVKFIDTAWVVLVLAVPVIEMSPPPVAETVARFDPAQLITPRPLFDVPFEIPVMEIAVPLDLAEVHVLVKLPVDEEVQWKSNP